MKNNRDILSNLTRIFSNSEPRMIEEKAVTQEAAPKKKPGRPKGSGKRGPGRPKGKPGRKPGRPKGIKPGRPKASGGIVSSIIAKQV